MSEELLRRAAAFVSAESGFQCGSVTSAQYAAATRRFSAKVAAMEDPIEEPAAQAPPHPARGRKATPQPRSSSASSGRVVGSTSYASKSGMKR